MKIAVNAILAIVLGYIIARHLFKPFQELDVFSQVKILLLSGFLLAIGIVIISAKPRKAS